MDCLREHPDERSLEHRFCVMGIQHREANQNVDKWKRNALWFSVAAAAAGLLIGRLTA
jgi:hypothetical protein